MDVVKDKNRKKLFSSKRKMVIGLIVALLILAFYVIGSSNSVSVNRSDIIIGTVKKGDLDVVVEGYGTLKSAKLQLLTSLTRATVKEILLKPGAVVTENSIVVKLENPELQQQVENAKQELDQVKANFRQLEVNQKRESLNENANLAEIDALYETAKLRRIAEESLVDDGIVAKITFQESLLNERQLKTRIEILKRREVQLAEVHMEAINIQRQKIKQQQGQLELAQRRVDKLNVRAGLNGVLQRLSVELGQSLSPGQEIALIGSVKELIALVKIPQSQAQQIIIDQQATIDTRRDKINGVIIRIDPVVENNTVTVEILLPNILPLSARPQANVDAVIIADKLINVNYIERPANVKPNTEVELYRIDDAYDNAQLRKIRFGRRAGRFVEIISGAKADEQYILSELAGLKTMVPQLKVK